MRPSRRHALALAVALVVAIPAAAIAQAPDAATSTSTSTPLPAMRSDYANSHDRALAPVMQAREADWRNGAVVYQVLVDRFAPPANLDAKRALYPPPKQLHPWTDLPVHGRYLPGQKLWSHEIDFWGGDLASLRGKLDYVQGLGADVLYLNPIALAYTNHKYDTLDYRAVSPEYGTRDDVRALARDVHARGMKLVLDGVFNHMGRNSPLFRQAESDTQGPYRDWFVFGPQYAGGARSWALAENLPELNLENPAVRADLFTGKDSVVRGWLRDGVDGWRLDVAFDIGFRYLAELTRAAHEEKPGSLVVGEIANYPKEWFPSVDGVLHFTLRQVILGLAGGRMDPATATAAIERLVADADYEHLLKSWVYLDNHDTPRLATALPDVRARRLAQVLQFTLPGSPNLYYGTELDMTGGDDPEMRAPMRWDRVTPGNAALAWNRQLVALHQTHRALRIGDFRTLTATKLLAYERYTERAADAVVVLANPSDEPVAETVMIPDSKIMDGTRMVNLLADPADPSTPAELRVHAALMDVRLPARGVVVLQPDTTPPGGYTSYKRVE
ncbi:MAG: glycoside hydrolase family 13 protein [Burkholderiaceae bacterium]